MKAYAHAVDRALKNHFPDGLCRKEGDVGMIGCEIEDQRGAAIGIYGFTDASPGQPVLLCNPIALHPGAQLHRWGKALEAQMPKAIKEGVADIG